jgi:hypothetical protein
MDDASEVRKRRRRSKQVSGPAVHALATALARNHVLGLGGIYDVQWLHGYEPIAVQCRQRPING